MSEDIRDAVQGLGEAFEEFKKNVIQYGKISDFPKLD